MMCTLNDETDAHITIMRDAMSDNNIVLSFSFYSLLLVLGSVIEQNNIVERLKQQPAHTTYYYFSATNNQNNV